MRAKRLSWKETAMIFGSRWDTVFRAVDGVMRWGLVNRQIGDIEPLGVDEIAYKRGHRYLTLVYQIDERCRRLLYVARDRTEEILQNDSKVVAGKREVHLHRHLATVNERDRRVYRRVCRRCGACR